MVHNTRGRQQRSGNALVSMDTETARGCEGCVAMVALGIALALGYAVIFALCMAASRADRKAARWEAPPAESAPPAPVRRAG